MDSQPFNSMAARRATQPAADPEASVRLVVDNPALPEPDEIGAPVPGAMAVLALTAFLVSVVLAIARVFGAPIPVFWVLSPIWGNSLAVAVWGLVHAIAATAADARDWVRRRGQ